MGLLGLLLEWLFPTREEPPHEDYHIDLYQKDGVDMLSLLRWERGQRNYILAGDHGAVNGGKTLRNAGRTVELHRKAGGAAKDADHLLRDLSDALWAGAFA